MLAWPLCYLLGSKNLVGPPMFPHKLFTIAERFRSGLHKLFQGPGQFSSIPQEKQERQLPYSTCLSSIILSPPNSNVKLSPHETGDIHVESEGTAASERD